MEATSQSSTVLQDPELRRVRPGLLSSPHIALYASKRWLVDGDDKNNLGPCSYNMRISGPILLSRNGITEEFTLCDIDDENQKKRTKVVLEPNSLTFFTTKEKFKLPRDVIARYNLKSKWVHQGLLLGTGPMVDPELHANILIPLHNFSSRRIEILNDEQIIMVEFTKTLDPEDKFTTTEGEELAYVSNGSKGTGLRGYIKRTGGLPESSVSSTLAMEKDERDDFKKKFKLAKTISIYGGIVFVISLCALLYQVFSLVSDINQYAISYNSSIVESRKTLLDLYEKISQDNVSIGIQIKELESKLGTQGRQFDERIKEITKDPSERATLSQEKRLKK